MSRSVSAGRILDTYEATELTNPSFSSLISVLVVAIGRALGGLVSHTPLLVLTLNPGFCPSDLSRNQPGLTKFFMRIGQILIGRPLVDGAQVMVYGAVGTSFTIYSSGRASDNLDNLRGAYVNLGRVDEPSDFIIGEEGKKRQDKIWVSVLLFI